MEARRGGQCRADDIDGPVAEAVAGMASEKMTLTNSNSTTRQIRRTGKGCRGAEAVRGIDRGAAMVLMRIFAVNCD